MRKKAYSLKEAKPALRDLIRHMKRKYGGRNIQFMSISQIPDDTINSKMPEAAVKFLAANPHIRCKGKEQGIEFYYYKKKHEGSGIYLLPIIVFYINREGNTGMQDGRLLVCSLDTYLPKLDNEEE